MSDWIDTVFDDSELEPRECPECGHKMPGWVCEDCDAAKPAERFTFEELAEMQGLVPGMLYLDSRIGKLAGLRPIGIVLPERLRVSGYVADLETFLGYPITWGEVAGLIYGGTS